MTVKEGIETDNRPSSGLPITHIPRGCQIARPDSARIARLSTPKDLKKSWWTTYGPPLVWGNQEPIWPLNPATLHYITTDRLKQLAVPKTDHRVKDSIVPEFQYSCGRESQIWHLTRDSLKALPSERTKELARHKTVPHDFQQYFTLNCGRSSPIWRPSSAALTAKPRPRTAQLACPKALHCEYQIPRQVETIVSLSAQKYEPTLRIHELATPKAKPDGPFREPEWPVSKGALQAETGQRLNELSRPKRLAEGYESSRDVIWKVTTGAKLAIASSRLSELSHPIIRETMDHLQFNPDVFLVSAAAKKYKATPRMEELAKPIQR